MELVSFTALIPSVAARPDTPWWEAGAEPVRDLAFVLLLAAPVVVVLTVVAGLLGRRVRLRLALDVVAAAWTWWMAWIVAASLESRHAEPTTPRLLYLLDVAYGMAPVAGALWIEERISARHLDGEARRTSRHSGPPPASGPRDTHGRRGARPGSGSSYFWAAPRVS